MTDISTICLVASSSYSKLLCIVSWLYFTLLGYWSEWSSQRTVQNSLWFSVTRTIIFYLLPSNHFLWKRGYKKKAYRPVRERGWNSSCRPPAVTILRWLVCNGVDVISDVIFYYCETPHIAYWLWEKSVYLILRFSFWYSNNFFQIHKNEKKKTLNFFEIKQCCTNFILLLAYFSKKPVLYARVASKERFVRSLVSFLNLSELFERPISFPWLLPLSWGLVWGRTYKKVAMTTHALQINVQKRALRDDTKNGCVADY